MKRIPRGNIHNEFQALSQKALVDAEWETLTLFNLLKVFQKVVTRLDQSKFVVHKIYNYEYTIGEQQEKIRYTLKISGKADFEKLFEECENRILNQIFRKILSLLLQVYAKNLFLL